MASIIATILYFIYNIGQIVLCILGIINFYNGTYIFTYIAAAIVVFANIYDYFCGQLKSFFTIIVAAIIGVICTGTLEGLCVGLCFENILMTVLSLPLLIIALKSKGGK